MSYKVAFVLSRSLANEWPNTMHRVNADLIILHLGIVQLNSVGVPSMVSHRGLLAA